MIIAKTQEELQDMVNRLVDTGRKYDMEINIDKSNVMRVSRSNESLWIKIDNSELKKLIILNTFKLYLKNTFIAQGKSR